MNSSSLGSAEPRPLEPAPVQERATRREWLGLAVIALPCMLYAMDLTVLNLAVPMLSEALRPTSAQLLWIIDIYGFMVAGLLIPAGTLGDRIGRRRLLLIGAACFAAASVLAALARTPSELIFTRALLGISGASLAPSTLSLIRTMFRNEEQRSFAVGVWIASYSVGGLIGPLVGGVLLEQYWWGSVFLLALPAMLLLLVTGPLLLPEYKDPAAGRLDLASALLSLLSVLATTYGFKRLAEEPDAFAALAIAVGISLGAVFVRRQRRLADPMLDLTMFRTPAFSVSLLGYGIGNFAMFGTYLALGQYMQLVLGLSPFQAGLWSAPSAGALVIGALVSPLLARTLSAGGLMASGMAVSALGFALLSQLDATSLTTAVVATCFVTFGMAPMFTLGNDVVVSQAPPERAGAAAAMSETTAELSASVGIALFGSIGTVVYRSVLAHAVEPALARSVPDAFATLGGAVAAAARLPESERATLLNASRVAFLESLHVVGWIAAAVVVVTAVLLGRSMRGRA